LPQVDLEKTMIDKPTMSRRHALSSLALPLIAASGASFAAAPAPQRGSGSPALVAYLSRSGNTRVIAGQLHRRFPSDLFEIRVADPYPDDYEEAVARASRERTASASPALADRVSSMAGYDTVFLGFPIWGMALPAPVRSFLTTHDLGGKRVLPFVTHGGYGVGNALGTLAELAPQARVSEPFVLKCDQERDTLNQVSAWLTKSRLA
jgi:flavodoxin